MSLQAIHTHQGPAMSTEISSPLVPVMDHNYDIGKRGNLISSKPRKVAFDPNLRESSPAPSLGESQVSGASNPQLQPSLSSLNESLTNSSSESLLDPCVATSALPQVPQENTPNESNDSSTACPGCVPTLASLKRPPPPERTQTAPLGTVFGHKEDVPKISVEDAVSSDQPNSKSTPPPPSSTPNSANFPPQRPRLNRFYSLPMHPMSPSRQHFRLHHQHPHQVKETLSVSFQEDARGKFINQYQITSAVGRGSFGMVYLALDENGQQYALKECSKQRLAKLNRAALMRLRRQALLNNATVQENLNVSRDGASPASSASGVSQSGGGAWNQHAGALEVNSLINREIAVMKKLDHPNLVSLYEVLDNPSSESLILVLEWCSQGSIMPAEEDYDGKAQPIPLDQARLYFRDLILGVEYLHSRGVCHRDIKADNVLLSDDDVVKLADFGVSEIFETSNQDGDDFMKRPVGSPAYMSPELVLLRATLYPGEHMPHPSNTPVSGRKADIWAMGVTLYYMVTGHLPFEGQNMDELHSAILTQQPDLSQLPVDLADLFARVLDKNPRTRTTLDELRVHAWVTQGDQDPLVSKDENVLASEDDIVTEDDIRDAIELIQHRRGSEGVALNYIDVSKLLRTNHGWRGDGTHSKSVTPHEGTRSPTNEDSYHHNQHGSTSPHGIGKMEKLSQALEELLRMRDWRGRY